jgi:hypothetical protein
MKPVVFTSHARQRMLDRGAREEDVLEAIRIGQREPARVAPIVAEEPDTIVVVTVYTFYF